MNFLNKYSDIVPEEYSLIILDIKSDVCMAKSGTNTKHTRNISIKVHFVRNSEKWKMHKIHWCDGGLKLADIVTKNVSDNDLNPGMKYSMVRLKNW